MPTPTTTECPTRAIHALRAHHRVLHPGDEPSGPQGYPGGADRDPIRVSPGDHMLGNPGATIEVVVYGDLTSTASARIHLPVQEAINRYPCIVATHRHLFPDGQPSARRAALAAEAVAQLGAFWPFLDRIYWWGADPSALRSYCHLLGLDEYRVIDHVLQEDNIERIEADRSLAGRCRAGTSPCVFINGVRWQDRRSAHLADDLAHLAERTRTLWDRFDRPEVLAHTYAP